MESFPLYMLAAAIASVVLATLCKLIINLLDKNNRRKKLSFKAQLKNLYRPSSIPLGIITVLTALTLLAHNATYAGSSMYAGYNLATPEAIPFFVLLTIDIVVIIYEIVNLIKNKATRKSKILGIIIGLVLGTIIAYFTLRIFIDLGFRMPWYGG